MKRSICLDTSVVVAAVYGEPSATTIRLRLRGAHGLVMGAPTLLEAHMVLAGSFKSEFDRFLAEMSTTILPFTDRHAQLASEAFDRFGKGRHPAGLNFGDCMAYATAKMAGLPLLYVGGDFSKTDLDCVHA